jgi:spermidine/putrescine transport system ATP-binding protein
MSDRIAVLVDGRVEQVGPPQEVYALPATTYVAGFLGAANIFDAELLSVDDGAATCSALDAKIAARIEDDIAPGAAAVVIRPERIALAADGEPVPDGHNVLRGMVRDIVYRGATTEVHVELPGGATLSVDVANHDGPSSVLHLPGSTVQCVCAPEAVRVLRRSIARAFD